MNKERILLFGLLIILFAGSCARRASRNIDFDYDFGADEDFRTEILDDLNISEDLTFTHHVDNAIVFKERVDLSRAEDDDIDYELDLDFNDIDTFSFDKGEDGITFNLVAEDQFGNPVIINGDLNADETLIDVYTRE